ncbi:hypothetical protein [Flavobacterium hercynium]|uniref:Transporter n=1 Tax=Flavobacterium hercynium TaxID=387094 RepID=A0A226H780_9FLAO|nr:hypothetical protein [Flavobacterium hercynium]OXA89506.1 hypothetical protein B0A66_13870 [Flavobacterium hercynium]SMP35793.1 hypothetical protein SAMN06265346_12041 [Flavobacterium hercynium]
MKKYQLIVFFSFLNFLSYAQGCSDAGICSIGSNFIGESDKSRNTIEVGTIFGKGQSDVSYISPYVLYKRNLTDQFSLSGKVTYSSSKGGFGTIGQLGDAYLVGNYTFEKKDNLQWSSTVGIKVPFSDSNSKINNISLPMDYQASLGTYDLIVGADLQYNNWGFNTSLQLPVINNNKNSYFDEYSTSNDFVSTNLFERKADGLLRVFYTINKLNSKFSFKPNVLFIYHFGKDSYQTTLGERKQIAGSEGATINGNLISSYAINSKNSIELSLATPFLFRKVRPDGLTRSFTAALVYRYSF